MAFIAALIWIVNLFYLLWGFNYSQPSIYTQLDYERISLDSNYIHKEFLEQTKRLSTLAQNATLYPQSMDPKSLEKTIRENQEKLLSTWNISTLGRVRIRKLPAGSLMRIRTSGIYIPHAIEGHFDGGLYYKQYPFTMAHEMAHGYGFTDESVCNFIAYLTCHISEDERLVYSAELAYWRYLAKYFKLYYPKEWIQVYENLDEIISGDLQEIRNHI